MSVLQHGASRPAQQRFWVTAAAALLLAACSSPPQQPGSAPPPTPPAVAAAPVPTGPTESLAHAPAFDRAGARWVGSPWSALPGWGQDDAPALWPALRQACVRPPEAWRTWCSEFAAQPAPSDAFQAHLWLMKTLQPYRVEALNGATEGLATGYFEPALRAKRLPSPDFAVPLWAPPVGAVATLSRAQLDALARRNGSGLTALAYLDDPLDAILLHIQGSGRVRITEADGQEVERRMAFAGHNQHPFRSLGRWLIDQGELTESGANWPAIRAWVAQNPDRLGELLAANPRVVFFREEPLTDPNVGPRGAQGIPLTPGRSVAVDPRAVPYGTLLWMDTTEPLSNTPLRRLVLAQDTGSAIVGAVRADLFWGWGDGALAQAGRMKQPLRWWALWPKGVAPS